MAKFVVTVTPYQGSASFDINCGGKNITLCNVKSERGYFGSRDVFTFQTSNDEALCLTIEKAMGNVNVELPIGWDCATNTTGMGIRDVIAPKVTMVRDESRLLVGYVTGGKLTLNFFKEDDQARVLFAKKSALSPEMSAHW